MRMVLRTHNLHSERLKMRLWWFRWSNVSWCRKAIWTHLQYSWHSIKQFGRNSGSDVLSRRMALRIQNHLSGRLKTRLWLIQCSDVSRFRNTMLTHFLHPGHRRKRLGRCRLSDDLIRLMVLWTHNLPSERLKMRLRWYPWSDASLCRKVIPTHFVHSGHSKKRFGRSDVLSRPLELIMCLLDFLINDFGKIDEVMFQGV
jgi:hypothetical protein